LRAYTPDDAKALKLAVSTFPNSGYDLQQVLMNLATGEAIVTVMNEKGAPSPVAWTRLRAPQGSMSPTPPEQVAATVSASPLLATYGTPIDRESAREILAARMSAASQADAAARAAEDQVKAQAQAAKEQQKLQADFERTQREFARARQTAPAPRATTRTTTRREKNPIEEILGSAAGKTVVQEIVRGIFGTLKRN
jgi:hypothetical protein